MQARLKVLHDKANVKQVKLLPVTLIGRSTDCNLKIASSQVSRNHCRITLGEDSVFVEDLGSANGTLVDGQLLAAHQPTAIAPGAHLIVGPAEFQIDFVAPTSATMVLPRSGVPAVPDMPSTEMIFPTAESNVQPTVQPATSVPQPRPAEPQPIPVPTAEESPAEVFAKSTVKPAEASGHTESSSSPAAPTAVPASPIPDVEHSPAAFLADATPQSQLSEPAEPESPFDFIANETAGESVEPADASPFEFAETVAEAASLAGSAPSVRSEHAHNKKGGLKSLFSLFGRKERQSTGAAHNASSAEAAGAPGVFLPTVEAQGGVEQADAIPESPDFEDGVPEASSPADTAELASDPTQQTSTDEDDGFQQFLSKL
jgi:hypothetical protein